MARCRYIPEFEKRERRYGRDDADFKKAGFEPERDESAEDETPWEFQSVENFVEDKMDSNCTTFTGVELQKLSTAVGIGYPVVRVTLEGYGLSVATPQRERNFATFGTNQHDRWTNEESRRMSGGGGGGSIMGMVD